MLVVRSDGSDHRGVVDRLPDPPQSKIGRAVAECLRGNLAAALGRVAEWQTRTVQVRVSVRTWGFNSPLAHEA